jgi:hypothetical protein
MSKKHCILCETELKKDYVALNKKLLGRSIEKYYCIRCLAEYIGCTIEDLLTKIEEFKEQGCVLFK